MHINGTNLKSLNVAFKDAFQKGRLSQAASQYAKFVTIVPSATGSNEYGWLGSIPGLREWLGDRVVHGIKAHGYTIKNRDFELTVGVPKNAVEDDQYGVYLPLMEEMGRSVDAQPDELTFGLYKLGPSTQCYDGQYFFDTDHPVINADGSIGTQSNWDNNSGSGTPWYLVDNSRAIRPIIYQDRKKPEFIARDQPTDDNVFFGKELVYGVDCRRNVGFGLWQLAYGSRKTLDETNLVAAYTAFCERTGDHGRPLGLKPDTLLVRPGMEFAARKLVSASTLANGAENVMKGIVKVESSPWLV